MIYKDFQDIKLSMLGFGTMRLPLREDGSVNEELTAEMVDYAISHGVNYFDTAYPYHNGDSERVVGKALSKHPRDKYYLATKYPGHQISAKYDPKAIFEEQLVKCGVEYFDFYLLHNVYENSIHTYKDERWGIVDYFIEQKRLGRIKHLGFSTHGGLENMKEFLEYCGKEMEFCQIQLNYLDWTLQSAKEKCELLAKWNLPIIVMEPLRGGKLVHLSEEQSARLKKMRPEEENPAWAFRFLQDIPNVTVVLSGMSDMQQMVDNIKTFEDYNKLNDDERAVLLEIAESMKDSIPCTGCRYCVEGCPKALDIPGLISIYNDYRVIPSLITAIRVEALDREKQPSACVKCGKCAKVCPQNIDIPSVLAEFADKLASSPKWAEVCAEREAAQKR